MNCFAAIGMAAVLLAPAYAQRSEPADLIRALDDTIEFRDIAISPDGNRIAWVRSGAVYWMARDGEAAKPVRVHARGSSAATPAWSPDSTSLAFFSDAGEKNGQMQLWTTAGESSDTRKRTKLSGYAESPRWLPGGNRIAFLYIEGASGGGPLTAAQAQTGVINAAIHNERIAVLDLSSGKIEFASPPDLNVYEFDSSPDGREFIGTAAPGPGDNNWWIAKLYRFDGSGQAKVIYKPELQIGIPRWSPNGERIAFLEGLMSDEGFFGGDLMTVSAQGGAATNHTRERKSSPSSLAWVAADKVLFTEWHGAGTAISTLDVKSGVIETYWTGAESIHADGFQPNFAVSRDGKASAAVRSSLNTPPEIWAGPVGEWKQLTHENTAQRASWGDAKVIEWTSENSRVHGWLLPPQHVEPGRRYPMIVWVHGGPSGIFRPSWPSDSPLIALLAAQGYFVLMPDPRGSYGQGEAFTRANVKDFGGGDLRDIMAGVDYTISHFPIDPERLGITGWSYGGYMTMFAVTQTGRFQAAVAGAGLANWTSYYGENLIDQWMIPFFGASVYDDPAVYAKSSPIQFIKNVKTPTLVIVGERDAECPAPQSFEFWHALKTLGVPTELVVYPGEGHRFEKREHRIDRDSRTLAWFEKYLGKK
jgi:dipeptidyl aminopeptidase/acylaminoacyl peptidase